MHAVSHTPISELPLLAFGFGSGWMLWFLTAAAAPVIIHLWNKRRHREIQWAAMRYLLAAIRNNSRRITVEQLILLLIRTLAVVLLALAVAEPFLQAHEGLSAVLWPTAIVLLVVPACLWLGVFSTRPRWQRAVGVTALVAAAALPLALVDFSTLNPFASSGGRRTHRLIILDGSYSMEYRPADESRFERAQEIARQIVQASLLGDGYTLIVMSQPPRVVVGTPVFDKDDFTDEINRLRLPHGGGDLMATLLRAEEVLQVARRDQPKLVQHEVHLVSDLGKTSWQLTSAAQQELRQQAVKLSQSAGLLIYDVGQPDAPNLAVTRAGLARASGDGEARFATVRRGTVVTFDVRNFGSQEQPQQVVELLVDRVRVDSTTITVPPRGQTPGRFGPYQFETPGEHVVEVRLAGDALVLDNSRWLSVPVKRQLRVLCVDGKPGQDFRQSGSGFLAQALRDGQATAEGQFQIDVDSERALRDRDLAAYDAVFLCNVAQFNQEEAAALQRFVSRGGGLVTFLGEKVRPESYNHWLAGEKQQSVPRVLPARLVSLFDRNKTPLANEDTFQTPLEHEIVRVFQRHPEALFTATPINKWYRLEPPTDVKLESWAAEVALQFVNKDPAIVVERIGRGRSILVATSADLGPENDRWSYMPSLQNFLPLVRELLSAAVAGQFEKRNLVVGEPLSGATGLLDAEARVRVKTPWASEEQSPIRAMEDHGRWSFTDTDESGVYEVRVPTAAGEPADAVFAANLNTRESDLSKITHAEVHEELLGDFPILTSWQGLQDRPAVVNAQRSFVDAWLLSAVCGLLLLETFLAWWFGRHGS